jgi:hypothetical protein
MVRHHKKTKKHSRRRRSMRGGGEWLKPWTWGKPSPPVVAAQGIADTVTDTTAAVAPLVPSPSDQAAALGTSPGGTTEAGTPILGPSAAMGGRRRRRTRKTRRKH